MPVATPPLATPPASVPPAAFPSAAFPSAAFPSAAFPSAPPSGFRVHPAELATAGQDARTAAERLRTGAAALPAAGDAAADAVPGWRTARALRECAAAWQQALTRLAAELDGLGGDLLDTAGNYRETETDLHRSLLRSR